MISRHAKPPSGGPDDGDTCLGASTQDPGCISPPPSPTPTADNTNLGRTSALDPVSPPLSSRGPGDITNSCPQSPVQDARILPPPTPMPTADISNLRSQTSAPDPDPILLPLSPTGPADKINSRPQSLVQDSQYISSPPIPKGSGDDSNSHPPLPSSPSLRPDIADITQTIPAFYEPDCDMQLEQEGIRQLQRSLQRSTNRPSSYLETNNSEHSWKGLDDDNDSDDDFEQTRTSHHDTKLKLYHLLKPTSPTTSKQEEEDLELEQELWGELEQELRGDITEESLAEPDGDTGHDVDKDDLDDFKGDRSFGGEQWDVRPGPIDDATRQDALSIKAQYEDCMLALAKERGVSLHSLYRVVGDLTPKHRAVSTWNAFQKYEAAHNGRTGGGEILLHSISLQKLTKIQLHR